MRSVVVAVMLMVGVAHGAEPDATKDAALEVRAKNNLKQIGLAFHNYHDVFGRFPPAVMTGPDGETLHSWRVELLPLLRPQSKQIRLVDPPSTYRKQWDEWIEADGYRLLERWDSDSNQEYQAKIPDVLRHPRDRADSVHTGFVVLTGAESAFSDQQHPKGIKLADIKDEPGNTLLVAEAKCGIPWIATDDLEFHVGKPFPKIGGFNAEGVLIQTCDGAVHKLAPGLAEADLRALTTASKGDSFTIPGIPWMTRKR